ncbi:MAG: 6-phosphofructokinase, partial [Ignavibacteria bacterium]|nr:6-phosphofructokinase [Ignavibacteria bacterium]
WIAVHAGIAGGADIILIPERPFNIDEVCNVITKRHTSGRDFSIVVVSEGAKIQTEAETDKDGSFILSSLKKDAFGHVRLGGIGNVLADEIEKRTGYETRASILGYIQRGGTPTAFDRVLATRFGVFAAELVHQEQWGKMAALKGNEIIAVDLSEATSTLKTVDLSLFEVAETFFG